MLNQFIEPHAHGDIESILALRSWITSPILTLAHYCINDSCPLLGRKGALPKNFLVAKLIKPFAP